MHAGRDVVLQDEAPVAQMAQATTSARSYTTSDGYSVEVEVSPSYPANPAGDQALVDFLGSRLHGAELGALRVYVGSPAEIGDICGGARVIACYSIDEARIYVPGEAVAGIPVEYPLTHEYGHHVANARSNNPWNALDWGAKNWASATRVCTHVQAGRLFPGNQGRHYLDDPGEGFADGYAHLHYPKAAWQYNDLMRPDRSAFAAIRRDVQQPWTGNRTRTFRGQFGPGSSTRKFKVRLTLDGEVSLRLAAPANVSYSVEADTRGFAAVRSVRGGGGYAVEWCRRRAAETVTLTVRRKEGARAGAAPFALTVEWPAA